MNRQYPEWVSVYKDCVFNKDGYSIKEGFHCWSLVRDAVNRGWGFKLPTYKEHFENAEDHRHIDAAMTYAITDWTKAESEWVKVDDAQLCDILFFKLSGWLWHCGLRLDREFMLNVLQGEDVGLGRYNDPIWKPRLSGAYRHRSLC